MSHQTPAHPRDTALHALVEKWREAVTKWAEASTARYANGATLLSAQAEANAVMLDRCADELTALLAEAAQVHDEAVTTYTPALWAVLDEDAKYEEYIRVRTRLAALLAEAEPPAVDVQADYDAAMAIFDARPQMGREVFSGTLAERVARIFDIRDRIGELAYDLAGGDAGEAEPPASPAEDVPTKGQLYHLKRENERLKAEIDAAWFAIEHGWDIEPRAHFEKEAPKNGFEFALAQAVHHMWKREVKADASEHVEASALTPQPAADVTRATLEGEPE